MLDKITKSVVGGAPVKDFQLSIIENPSNPLAIDFNKIANSRGLLAFNALQEYIENGHDQITITGIPDGSWNSVNSISVGLVNNKTGKPVALKTAGVYVTKINKILNGVNPHDGVNFKASRMFTDFVLLHHSDKSVKLVHSESGKIAIVHYTGKVECEDYMLFNNAIYALLNPLPGQVFTRFIAGIESDNGKIELCKPPQLVIKYLDYTIAMTNDKPESINAAKGRLMLELMTDRIDFTSQDIQELTPIIDGRNTWLTPDFTDKWYSARKS